MQSDINVFCELLTSSKQFDKLEIQILRAMLTLKQRRLLKNTASDIASVANLSVTNAYKYLYSLQQKGIVESNKAQNKIFWLSQTSNPFPRILSYVGKEYLKKKELFEKLKESYEKFVQTGIVWGGEQLQENYEGNFIDRAIFLFDAAKEEILVTTQSFYDDFLFLDALKRAVERGIKIKIVSEEIHPEITQKLRKIGIEIRLGLAWPYLVLIDNSHGITVDKDGKGFWFLNYKTNYKPKFEELWQKAEVI